MEKMFVYNVNGTVLEDTEAFGQAWAKAKEIATNEHTYIARQVVKGNDIRNEVYVKGGVFINEDKVVLEDYYIF